MDLLNIIFHLWSINYFQMINEHAFGFSYWFKLSFKTKLSRVSDLHANGLITHIWYRLFTYIQSEICCTYHNFPFQPTPQFHRRRTIFIFCAMLNIASIEYNGLTIRQIEPHNPFLNIKSVTLEIKFDVIFKDKYKISYWKAVVINFDK